MTDDPRDTVLVGLSNEELVMLLEKQRELVRDYQQRMSQILRDVDSLQKLDLEDARVIAKGYIENDEYLNDKEKAEALKAIEKAPVLSEAFLYPLLGKEDARSLLYYIGNITDVANRALYSRFDGMYMKDKYARLKSYVENSDVDRDFLVELVKDFLNTYSYNFVVDD